MAAVLDRFSLDRVVSAVETAGVAYKVRPHEALPNPDVTDSEEADQFRILTLDALVQINWTTRYPPELAPRLQLLIDTPEG